MASGRVAATHLSGPLFRDRFEFTSAYVDTVSARARCWTAACLSVRRGTAAGSAANACLWPDERSDSSFVPALAHLTATGLRKPADGLDTGLYLAQAKDSRWRAPDSMDSSRTANRLHLQKRET